jgi:hypothetical protein
VYKRLLVTYYRRHSASCKNTVGLNDEQKRLYLDCECPVWVAGHWNGEKIPRQSLETTDLQVAKALVTSRRLRTDRHRTKSRAPAP